MDNNKKNTNKRKITSKQVIAMGGVVLLALMYIVTMLVALFDTSTSGNLLLLCLFATVAIPILIWIYIWMYGKLTNKKTIADFNIGVSDTENQQ